MRARKLRTPNDLDDDTSGVRPKAFCKHKQINIIAIYSQQKYDEWQPNDKNHGYVRKMLPNIE